jgi:quercetin dioxygenase-like cupin family protein
MPRIDNANPKTYDLHDVRFSPIASPGRGARETAIWRAVVTPHTTGVLHHMTREEIILCVSGTGLVRLGGEDHTLAPGDAFAVPAFTDFQLEAAGDIPFEAVVVLPAGGRGVIGKEPFTPPWSL